MSKFLALFGLVKGHLLLPISGRSRIFQEDANCRGECSKLLFCKMFAENWKKMKEFGQTGGAQGA